MKKIIRVFVTGLLLISSLQGCNNPGGVFGLFNNSLKGITSVEYTYSCGFCMGQPSEIMTVSKDKILLRIVYNDKNEFKKEEGFTPEEFNTLTGKLNLNELGNLPEDITADNEPTDGPSSGIKLSDGSQSKEIIFSGSANSKYYRVIADFAKELDKLRRTKFSSVPVFYKQTERK